MLKKWLVFVAKKTQQDNPPANSLWEIREHVLHIKCNFRLHFAFLGNLVVDSIEPRFSASDSIEGLLQGFAQNIIEMVVLIL